jgi:hypothetical protein
MVHHVTIVPQKCDSSLHVIHSLRFAGGSLLSLALNFLPFTTTYVICWWVLGSFYPPKRCLRQGTFGNMKEKERVDECHY